MLPRTCERLASPTSTMVTRTFPVASAVLRARLARGNRREASLRDMECGDFHVYDLLAIGIQRGHQRWGLSTLVRQ